MPGKNQLQPKTFPIGPQTIPQGVAMYPSASGVSTGAGYNDIVITLDIGNLTPENPCQWQYDLSPDNGQTWGFLASGSWSGPYRNRQGVLQTSDTARADLGTVFDANGNPVPILTTAQTKLRLTLTSAVAWATAGGTLSAN